MDSSAAASTLRLGRPILADSDIELLKVGSRYLIVVAIDNFSAKRGVEKDGGVDPIDATASIAVNQSS